MFPLKRKGFLQETLQNKLYTSVFGQTKEILKKYKKQNKKYCSKKKNKNLDQFKRE